ncbi:MAG: hypothetical protein PHI23_02130 [Candidatus Peribacteraceae bacterium]|nr:hypothetical protein [Candidatus Peribacteraceae bacterium]
MELQQIKLPELHVPPLSTTREEHVRLTERDHWYDLEIDQAKGEEDEVRFAILGVVQELDRLLNFGSSFFFDPEAYEQYCTGKLPALHLNSASHAPPFPEAKRYAERIYHLFERKGAMQPMNRKVRLQFLQHVREQVAARMDLKPHQVVLCRNTTEAARIAALISGILTTGDIQREILFTDDVHISILLHLLLNDDPGNADRRDRFSSWPTYFARRGQNYDPLETRLGRGEFGMFSVKGKDLDQIKQQIDECLPSYWGARTIGLIVLPHVLRETGAILPIREICDYIRETFKKLGHGHIDLRQPFILIDGAQAEGTVPGFRFRFKHDENDEEGIDCNAYIVSPHKTEHSDVLGLLYLRDRQNIDYVRSGPGNTRTCSELGGIARHIKNTIEQGYLTPEKAVVLDGMFDPCFGIHPNVRDHLDCADAAGYLAAQNTLIQQENILPGYTCAHRARLKKLFRQELQGQCRRGGTRIVLPRCPFPESPFIQSIRFLGTDGRDVVESLRERVFMSWIGEEGAARASFGLTNTEEEVCAAAQHIAEACKKNS